MTQTNSETGTGPDSTGESDSADQGVASNPPAPTSPSTLDRARRHRTWGVVGLLLGGGVLAYFQINAADTDYQHAFLRSAAALGVTLAWVAFHFQRSMAISGRRWWLPTAVLVVGILAVGLVRVESLSGEMIPQLGWRFASVKVPPPQPLSTRRDNEVDATGIESGVQSELATPGVEDKISAPGWRSFLGSDRDGVTKVRDFDVPESLADIRQRWNIGIGGGWSSFAVDGALAVTLEQREDRECVTAYRIDDGSLVWEVEHVASHFNPLGQGGPRSTPAIRDGRVFAQGATGMVWCLEFVSGRLLWSRDLLEVAGWSQEDSEEAIAWGRAGSPLLVDDLCVVPLGGPDSVADDGRSLIALDVQTGQTRWRSGEDQISYASPQIMVFDDQRQIVSVNEQTITGHQVEDGRSLWSFDFYGQSNSGANCAAAMPAGEGRFLIGKGYGGGSALIQVSHREEGWIADPVWTSTRVLKTKFNHAVVRDGVAYGISNGALQAVDIESGQSLWQQSRRDRCGQGQVILAGDVLIVQAEAGEVILVEATGDAYREWIRIDALHHKTWNIPSLVGRTLLVRNDRQAIAIELPSSRSSSQDVGGP